MRFAVVLGSATQTIHHPAYDGQKLMVCQGLDENRKPLGPSFLAVDSVQAGAGDEVIVLFEGNGIRQIFGVKQLPIQSLIVGIVDHALQG